MNNNHFKCCIMRMEVGRWNDGAGGSILRAQLVTTRGAIKAPVTAVITAAIPRRMSPSIVPFRVCGERRA